ncbi:MAG TPA: hypothetical protein VEK08_14565 [Planctomycetota bacterium]|nr:hypothetical protein [Planctomycetota bacterium]
MPCCVVLLVVMALPRVALFLLWFTSTYISRAYQTTIWPLLGFFFMPYTTLAYAGAMNNGGLQGLWLVIFVIAVLVDMGVVGGSAKKRRDSQFDENGLKRVN